MPAPCSPIAKSNDRIVPFGEGRPFSEGVVIEVMASDVAQPKIDGVFTVGGVDYRIIGDPEQRDDLRLVWTCRVQCEEFA
jgi:hypothetical protein